MQNNAPHAIEEWLENRTISKKILEDFGVFWNQERIIIQVFAPDGTFLFNKYRRSPFLEDGAKYRYDTGATSALYGAHKIKDASTVIVCEGELDALALWSHGFHAVSTTGGAGTFDPRWAELLAGKRVVICYDNDLAGHKGALHVQSILPDAVIALLPKRQGVKDITDFFVWLKANGRTDIEVAMLFNAAKSYPMFECPIPEKAEDRKILKAKYMEQVNFGYEERSLCRFSSTAFLDLYIKYYQDLLEDICKVEKQIKYKSKPGKEISIPAARAVPMTQYIKFDRQGFTKCLWHKEDTASLHYILKSNRAYCFGSCQRAYDVIDVVCQQQGTTLPNAVDFILGVKKEV